MAQGRGMTEETKIPFEKIEAQIRLDFIQIDDRLIKISKAKARK